MANWTRRDFFRVSAVTGAVALGGPALLAGCSEVPQAGEGGTLQRVRDAGTIKVGIDQSGIAKVGIDQAGIAKVGIDQARIVQMGIA